MRKVKSDFPTRSKPSPDKGTDEGGAKSYYSFKHIKLYANYHLGMLELIPKNVS
ncbi:MAG TPA: hypothetical protein VJ903_05040 [Clostridia bacterium]|nr:hypothetical protein [Clostridia bacterium]